MTQSRQPNESMSGMHEMMGVGGPRAEAITQVNAVLLKQIEGMRQGWLSRAQASVESAADLASRCSKCSNPGEMAGLYGGWLTKRMEAFFADNRYFADQWLALFDAAIAPLKAAQAEADGKAAEHAPAAEPVAEPAARSRAARA